MVDRPLRVVFFGTPEFAVPTLRALLASGHHVVGVMTQPARRRGRGQKVTDTPVKQVAVQQGVPTLEPETLRDGTATAALTAWRPDLGVVAAYGKIIPEAMLAVPTLGMINVHASLLPRYRGAAPVHRAVIDGEPETGVTIMRVVKALDAGAMFAKVRRVIGPDETSDVVERDLAAAGASLLVTVVDRIADGTATEEPQDDRRSTYAPRLTKEEGLLDWTLPASSVHNRVRGLHPWPHAYSYIGHQRVIILATRMEAEATNAEPGTIVNIGADAIDVAAGHSGRLAVRLLQPEGRRPMSARDFLGGHPLTVGMRFGAP